MCYVLSLAWPLELIQPLPLPKPNPILAFDLDPNDRFGYDYLCSNDAVAMALGDTTGSANSVHDGMSGVAIPSVSRHPTVGLIPRLLVTVVSCPPCRHP